MTFELEWSWTWSNIFHVNKPFSNCWKTIYKFVTVELLQSSSLISNLVPWLSFVIIFIENTFNILPWYFRVHLLMFILDALDFLHEIHRTIARTNLISDLQTSSNQNFLAIDTSFFGNIKIKNLKHSCSNNYWTYLIV